ncbi:MAG: aldehyde ferredoxin oxidoreductase N-terminal domain-containing protein [Anaerolineae bacterium]
MKRHLLVIDAARQSFRLRSLPVETLEKDPREEYFVLSGEALCQYLLREDHEAMILARGPMPFLSGNKVTIGYLSPLTDLPHYSFVGGRAARELLNLGLDAIVLVNPPQRDGKRPYIVVSGQAPDIRVEFKDSSELPSGQRSAFYFLVEEELGGQQGGGSVFTLGDGAYHGYRTANLALEAIYHAGRGGAGIAFARYASALVLRGEEVSMARFFGAAQTAFARNPNAAIGGLLERYCERLSRKDGGTITKLVVTGKDRQGKNTLPSWNAQRLGYAPADIGDTKVLLATRHGHTGCHWCQVDCRHWHWVEADYAPEGRDVFLDDFEPTYSAFAMLGLLPKEDTFEAKVRLRQEVDRRIILPIEQMGCDIIDVGLGIAALFEGLEKGLIPEGDVPSFLRQGEAGLGSIEAAGQIVELLRAGAADYPAIKAIGHGPQALAALYPQMKDSVFTCGKGTLGNAGHCNALWTFLMPFSRFFSHYAGQIYKIEGDIPAAAGEGEIKALFEDVIRQMLQMEYLGVLCNCLSCCAFTFVIFSQDGEGEKLDEDGLLVEILGHYGITSSHRELMWFAQAFWAQSIDLKVQFGWRPPAAQDFPSRVFEALSLTLERTPEELRGLMDLLIDEWKRQAGGVMQKFGYEVVW